MIFEKGKERDKVKHHFRCDTVRFAPDLLTQSKLYSVHSISINWSTKHLVMQKSSAQSKRQKEVVCSPENYQ